MRLHTEALKLVLADVDDIYVVFAHERHQKVDRAAGLCDCRNRTDLERLPHFDSSRL